jgi:6-phosphogluconolactonase
MKNPALAERRYNAAMDAEIRVFPTRDELNCATADRFCLAAQRRLGAGSLFCAALSGGLTPRELYQLLAEPGFARQIPWDATHLFQVDERAVPPGDPESNFGMIREAMLARAPLPSEHFHRMAAESQDLEEAARRYSQEIAEVMRPGPREWPRFDLILLGLGPDGHTASLFPGSAALEERERWVVPNYVEKLKAWRLTLTLPVINSAAEVIFLLSGPDKAEIVRRVLHPASPADSFPAQRVQPASGQLRWYLDQSAARLL